MLTITFFWITMKEFKYTINGNKYEVAVGNVNNNIVELTVNGEQYTVELEKKEEVKEPVKVIPPKPAAATAAKTVTSQGDVNGEPVRSPLPGVIKDVLVNVGDKVEEGQTVVVLEAMKMANNLDAEKGGTVTAVLVATGDSVMENTPLVVIG